MIRFKADRHIPFRTVACRIAMCLGVRNLAKPLAWEEGDDGAPFWLPDSQKFQLDHSGNYWLRKDKESLENAHYTLAYRYTTPDRQTALEGLRTWLECDLMFGDLMSQAILNCHNDPNYNPDEAIAKAISDSHDSQ